MTEILDALGIEGLIELVDSIEETVKKRELPNLGVPFQRQLDQKWAVMFMRRLPTDAGAAMKASFLLGGSDDDRFREPLAVDFDPRRSSDELLQEIAERIELQACDPALATAVATHESVAGS